jgi:hypothetical protein
MVPPAGRAGPTRWLVVLEVLLVIGAVGGGLGLIVGFLDLEEMADDLPWQSPVLGGVALLLLNALVPSIVVAAELRRHRLASLGHLLVGVDLLGWIVVQVAFIGFTSPLQAVYAVYGVAVTALAWRLPDRPGRRPA